MIRFSRLKLAKSRSEGAFCFVFKGVEFHSNDRLGLPIEAFRVTGFEPIIQSYNDVKKKRLFDFWVDLLRMSERPPSSKTCQFNRLFFLSLSLPRARAYCEKKFFLDRPLGLSSFQLLAQMNQLNLGKKILQILGQKAITFHFLATIDSRT